MGRAIVRQPAVFLFDEPLSNLDAALRVQMRSEIRSLHERLQTTSIFVTHDQVQAMTMADRIVVMRAGRLEQAGPPLDLYDRPLNAFVAGFIGAPAMNLIAGPLIGLSPDILYGIGPEHLDLVPPDTPDAIHGRVTGLESTGTAMFVAVQTEAFILNALFSDRPQLKRGDQIALRPRQNHHHLFDARTLLRLP